MAKRDAPDHDPSIAAAVFCENVLVERDGTHSLIRVVDSVSMYAGDGVEIDQEHALTHPLALAIILRSENADGTKHITVRHTPPPNGTKLGGLPQAADIDVSPGRLTVATVRLTGGHIAAGRHVFEIRIGGGAIAKAPLEVHVQRPDAAPDDAGADEPS